MAEKDDKGRKPLIEKFLSLFAKEKTVSVASKKEENILKSLIDKDEVRKALATYKEEDIKSLSEESTVFEALESREFKEFELDERQLRLIKSFFEKACVFFGKIIQIRPDPKAEATIKDDLKYLWLNVTPAQVMSLGVFMMLGFLLVTIFLMLTGLVCTPLALMFGAMGVAVLFLMPKYPHKLAEQKRRHSMGEMPIIILYLVMYLRNNPVMEGAVRFAAIHLDGPIAMDFRKLLWDVEIRKYLTVSDALEKYSAMWSRWNREFADAVRLVISSANEVNPKRRLQTLDMAVGRILATTAEKMEHYTMELRMPVEILHALGVVLPVMGLVMFPMVVMFMSHMVDIFSLFVFYDVILAGIVFLLGMQLLGNRPATITTLQDVEDHPDIPRPGCYKLKFPSGSSVDIPMIYPAAAAGLLVASPGIIYMFNRVEAIMFQFKYVFRTLTIVWGIALAFYLYYKYTSIQKVKIRQTVVSLENEFPDALFQIGNQLMSGIAIERAIGASVQSLKGTAVNKLFGRVYHLMTNLNMTFEKALFDKKNGALVQYPSKMISSVMNVIVQSAQKGMKEVAYSMIAISKYLRNIHKIEENVKETLGETVGSMQFQGVFLAPGISGVVVGLGIMIMQILIGLHTQIQGLSSVGAAGPAGMGGMGLDMLGGGFLEVPNTPPEIFQLVVGIYMLEACIMLTMFATGISTGKDRVVLGIELSKAVIIATVIYTIGVVVSGMMFGGLVGSMMIM